MVDGKPFEVVGIVRYEGLRAGGETAHPYLFGSDTGRRQQGSLFVRVKGDASAALPALRREIRAVDAGVPINQAMSHDQRHRQPASGCTESRWES